MAEKLSLGIAVTANEREAIMTAAKSENRSFSNFVVTRILEVLKTQYDIVPEEEID